MTCTRRPHLQHLWASESSPFLREDCRYKRRAGVVGSAQGSIEILRIKRENARHDDSNGTDNPRKTAKRARTDEDE